MSQEKSVTLEVLGGLRDGIRNVHPEGAVAVSAAIELLEFTNELHPWLNRLEDVVNVLVELGEAVLLAALRDRWPRLFGLLIAVDVVEGSSAINWDALGRLFEEPQSFDDSIWKGRRVGVFMGLAGMLPRAIEALESDDLTWKNRPPLPGYGPTADPAQLAWEAFRDATDDWVALNFPVIAGGHAGAPLDHIRQRDRAEPEADMTLAWREDDAGWVETWLFPRPGGEAWTHDLGDHWFLHMEPAVAVGFANTSEGWRAYFEPSPHTPVALDQPVVVTINRNTPIDHPTGRIVDYRFGPPDINLTLGDIGAELRIKRAEPHVSLKLAAKNVSFVIAPRALGPATLLTQGLRFDLDFELDFDSRSGLGLALRSAAEMVFDIHRDENTFPWITRVRLVAELDATHRAFGARLRVHLTIVAKFDNFVFVVDGFGAWMGYWPPPDLFQHTYYGLTPPYGLGLEITTDSFTGGGFLDFEGFEENRYSGTVFVETGGLRISALGAYEKLDDGKDSLVVAGGIRFPQGAPLPFGFTLDGFGVLVALHRRIDADELRARVVTGAIRNLLYAPDPVANAPRLLDDLEAIFPVARNVQAIGASLELSWRGFVRGQFGLVFEYTTGDNEYGSSGLTKVLLLGSSRLSVPTEKKDRGKYVNIQADDVGIIDIPRGEITYDSTLFDSTVLDKKIKISGDAAARLRTKAPIYFLVSVGGVHPSFDPTPCELPNLRRAGAAANIKWGWIELDASLSQYFSISSTAIQLGAEIRLSATVAKLFRATAFFGFDAICEFSPFYFSISAFGGAEITFEPFGLEIVKCFFVLELSGPGPLVVTYTFAYSLLFGLIKDSYRGTAFLGDPSPQTPSFSDKSLLDIVSAEFQNKQNLESTGGEDPLCDAEVRRSDDLWPMVSPLARLRWSQLSAPVDCLCDRAAGQRLATPQAVVVEADVATSGVVQRLFAPSAYTEMDAARALNGASFDQLDAGLELGWGWASADAHPVEAGVATHVLDLDVTIESSSAVQPPPAVTMAAAARSAPASIASTTPVIIAHRETWEITTDSGFEPSPSAFDAAQRAVHEGGVAVPLADAVDYIPVGP